MLLTLTWPSSWRGLYFWLTKLNIYYVGLGYGRNTNSFKSFSFFSYTITASCLNEVREIVPMCYGPYSHSNQDKTPFNTPGWVSVANLTNKEELEKLCPRPWRYQTAEETETFPKWGDEASYAGGGYVADLGYSIDTASGVIDSLELRGWLDRKTRVVMVEFAFFNPTTNILSVSTYFFERFPTGGTTAFTRTRTISLYSQDTGIYHFYLICQLLFILLTLFYLVRECLKLFRQRLSYFESPWNWLELTQILVAILAVVFYIVKVDEATKTIRELQENVYANVSFDAAILWAEVETGLLAILTFIVSLKLLRLVRFNHQVTVFSATLYIGFKRLLSFTVVLLIAFLAFLHFGMLIFGETMERFSTLKNAVYFQLELILGKVKARPMNELATANESFGRVFAGALLMSLTIVFMNFFIAVINDALLDAQAKGESETETDTTQITLVKKTQGSATKLDFGRISDAIKRMKPSSSEKKEVLDSNRKPCEKLCKGRSGGHTVDFESVSAAMIALRRENKVNVEHTSSKEPLSSVSVDEFAQTKLDFDKISGAIKRNYDCKESTSKSDGAKSTSRRTVPNSFERKVRFADNDHELRGFYSNLEKKQSQLFELIEEILSLSSNEESTFGHFMIKYKDTIQKAKLAQQAK